MASFISLQGSLKIIVYFYNIMLLAASCSLLATLGTDNLQVDILVLACCIILPFFMWHVTKQRAKGWAWCILPVFIIGFFVKSAIIAREVVGGVVLTAYLARYLPWLTRFELEYAVEVSALSFLLFMCSAIVVPSSWFHRPLDNSTQDYSSSQINLSRVNVLLVATVFIFILTTLLPPLLGFGQMGLEHKKLPFRLDAFVTRTRIVLIPFIMIILLWLLDRPKYRNHWIFGVILYLVFSLADAWMRGSRSSVALAAIPMLILWVVTNKITAARKGIIALCGMAVVLSYPIFTALRLARVRGTELMSTDIFSAISDVLSIDGLYRYINALIGRFQGINGLLLSLDYVKRNPDSSSLIRLVDQSRMAFFHTHRVAGVPDEMIEGCAPGFLGGFINAGGLLFMYGAVIATPFLIHFVWQKLRAIRIHLPAVAFGSLTLFLYINEGTFGLQTPIAFIIALLLGSAVTKWLCHVPMRPSRLSTTSDSEVDGQFNQ